MLSSIAVSFGGGFSFSLAGLDEVGAASIFIGSASAGADWLLVSGKGLDFWVINSGTGEVALDACDELNSSTTPFWCWLEDVLEAGDGGSSICGSVAAAGLRLEDTVFRTLAPCLGCNSKQAYTMIICTTNYMITVGGLEGLKMTKQRRTREISTQTE